ncbi:MAG: glycosyltransferase family 9 protein [Cytophagaceae bacterium]
MKEEKFDLAIQIHGKGTAANPFIKKLGARITAGLKSPDSESLDFSLPFYYYQNEVIRYLEVAQMLGAKAISTEPKINILQEDYKELQEQVAFELENSIIIHPVGMDERRMWSKEKYAVLADTLYKNKHQVIFTGSSDDAIYINEIMRLMHSTACNLAGKLSLGGMAALFSKTKLTISVDTGPLHLAIASGSKTIGLYWAPNVINWAPLNRSKHYPVISWNLICNNCGIIPNNPYPFEPTYNQCRHEISFLENIEVNEVIKAVDALIK